MTHFIFNATVNYLDGNSILQYAVFLYSTTLMKLLYYSFNLKLNLSYDLCNIYFSTLTLYCSQLRPVFSLPTLVYRDRGLWYHHVHVHFP